jgi:hypothetical protein
VSSEQPRWKEACKAELANMADNGAYELPCGARVALRMWVFTYKLQADGSIGT